MALNITPKTSSANSNTPSATVTRKEVSVARPTASTSRAEAFKKKLAAQVPAQPVAPRPTGSSARREEMAKLNKFNTPAPQQAQPKQQSRVPEEDLTNIAPPPSGLAAGQDLIQPNTSVETPEKTPEAPSEPLSPQFVALARKERQVRRAQQELKAAQDAWKQDQVNFIPKSRLKSETLAVLAEEGITPDNLFELQLKQASSQDPQQVLLNKIADLESKLTGLTDPENGTLAQRDKANYDQALEVIREDATLLVDSDPSYGLIKSEGQTEEVVKLIATIFDEEGKILSVEEAAGLVEEKLTQRLAKQYDRLSKFEKLKAKIGKPAETQEEAAPAQLPQQKPMTNTLTNAGALQRPLSARDRAVLKVQEALDARKRK